MDYDDVDIILFNIVATGSLHVLRSGSDAQSYHSLKGRLTPESVIQII